MKLFLRLCLALALLGIAMPAAAQDFNVSYNFPFAGTNGPKGQDFTYTGINTWFIAWHPVGPIASCAIQVDSSSDNSSWGSADVVASQDCKTAGSASGSFSSSYVRINVTALIGAGLNVTLKGYGGGGGIPSSGAVNYVSPVFTHSETGVFTGTQNNFYNVFSLTGGSGCDAGTVISKIATIQATTQKYTEGATTCVNIPAGSGLVTNGQNNGIGGYVINNNSSQQGQFGLSYGTGTWGACYSKASNTACEGIVGWVTEDTSLSGNILVGMESSLAPQNSGTAAYGYRVSPFGSVQPTSFVGYDVHGNYNGGTTLPTLGFYCEDGDLTTVNTYYSHCLELGRHSTSSLSLSDSIVWDVSSNSNAHVSARMEASPDNTTSGFPALRFGNTANDTTAATTMAVLPDHGTVGVSMKGSISAGSCTLSSGTCSVTFSNAYSTAPHCVASGETTANTMKSPGATTGVVITSSSGSDTQVVDYICVPSGN